MPLHHSSSIIVHSKPSLKYTVTYQLFFFLLCNCEVLSIYNKIPQQFSQRKLKAAFVPLYSTVQTPIHPAGFSNLRSLIKLLYKLHITPNQFEYSCVIFLFLSFFLMNGLQNPSCVDRFHTDPHFTYNIYIYMYMHD